MLEKHEREQYFWTDETLTYLSAVAARFENPCCLCTPTVGQELGKQGVRARVLDIDERFADVAGFLPYDIYRPTWLGEKFGVVLCDPPFWIVSLSQLFRAIRLLAQQDYEQPLAICYPQRRGANLCTTFARFGLKPTGFLPKYRTVPDIERNQIEFFANFEWN